MTEHTLSNLAARCQELLDWNNTGLLNGGKRGILREMAAALEKSGLSDVYSLSVAESQTKDEAMRFVVQYADELVKALEQIEYASRKDSLTEHERIQSVRTVVCAALSRLNRRVGTSGDRS